MPIEVLFPRVLTRYVAAVNAPMSLADPPGRLRLRVDDYLLLNDSGAFAAYAKTELIDGDIYGMNAQFTRHARIKFRLARRLADRLDQLGSDLEVLTEVTVRIADDSAPEPDVVVTRFRGDREVPADTVALLVEVADTTLEFDLGRKADLYAAAGVPEYWVVDVNGGRVVRHGRPAEGGYADRDEVTFGATLASTTIDGLAVDTVGLAG